MQNVELAKVALRPGAGNMVNGILRKLVVLKVLHFFILNVLIVRWNSSSTRDNINLEYINGYKLYLTR